ncbi:MAG: peptidoglycan recognition family protein [Elusimicrobiota bacterium]
MNRIFFAFLTLLLTCVARAEITVSTPVIIARAEWGAAEAKYPIDPLPEIYRGAIHNTAGNLPLSLRAAKSEMKGLQLYHQHEGWADIGYHFAIDGAGRIFEGRPLYLRGAHAKVENNDGNVGVALMGNFSRYQPTPAQWESLKRLLLWLTARYQIEPGEWKGHRDYNSPKGCPGFYVYKQIPALRKWLANAIKSGQQNAFVLSQDPVAQFVTQERSLAEALSGKSAGPESLAYQAGRSYLSQPPPKKLAPAISSKKEQDFDW